MFFNDRVEFAELGSTKAARFDQLDRIQPEFGVALCLFYMNMTRLVAFTTEKEKAKATNAKNFWHANE